MTKLGTILYQKISIDIIEASENKNDCDIIYNKELTLQTNFHSRINEKTLDVEKFSIIRNLVVKKAKFLKWTTTHSKNCLG